MRGIDTNVLVRFLTQDDAQQARKVDRLIADTRARRETLYVNAIVLCETIWVLRSAYRQGPGDFADYFIGARNLHAGCDTTATLDTRLAHADAFSRL